MSDNWVVQNLENALETWNDKLSEIWQLLTTTPQNFKGGSIWNVMVTINGAVQAIGLALLVLFFVVGVVRTCGSFTDVKKPEHALKLFVRFAIAKGVITYGLELMLALFNIIDLTDISNLDEYDDDDRNTDDLFSFGKKVKIDLADMDYISWRDSLAKDAEILELLTLMVGDITPEHDSKLQKLLSVINEKIRNPINEGNKKVIIFTAFADTADYLYNNVSKFVKKNFGLNTAMISGSVEGRTTCQKLKADLHTVLTCFSPISKDKELLMPNDTTEIDVLIATDCISEGQNLQDCDYLINYDIHWNPVRIIQRFGRIDRIGSRNKVIQLVNFWPDVTLDEYINLKAKVETRMKIVDMTATGDDNLLSDEEKTDLEYRKAQLKRLQDEVVDIEDMTTGISIMDLGLNEFRLDLLDYIKLHPDIDKAPFGLSAVAPAGEDTPAGVIYVLKNRSNSVNIDNQNRLHPFYMVYISDEGEVICDHLSPKNMLDKMRFLCKGKTEPIPELPDLYVEAFGQQYRKASGSRTWTTTLCKSGRKSYGYSGIGRIYT